MVGGTAHAAARGFLTTSSLTLVSRILGFVRDLGMASLFGVSPLLGAFAIAWALPNTFRRLLGEGVVGSAVLPALDRAHQEGGEDAARDLYSRFHGWILLLLVSFCAFGLWVLHSFLQSAEGSENQALAMASSLFPYVVPVCLAAIATAPQHRAGRFLGPALAPVLLNLVWIVWIFAAFDRTPQEAARGLCFVLILGGVLQWAVQQPGLKRAGFPLIPRFGDPSGRVRATLKQFAPALLGLAALQINTLVDQVLVYRLVDASANSYIYLSERLLQLPYALLVIAGLVGTTPWFTRLGAGRQLPELNRALRIACEPTLAVTLCAAVGLAVLALPIVHLLFVRGEFAPEDATVLAAVVLAYIPSLPFAALAAQMVRARQALGDYRGPSIAAAVCVPLNLLLDFFLLPKYGVVAAGWATSCAMAAQFFVLAAGQSRHGLAFPLALRRLPHLLLPALGAGFAPFLVFRLPILENSPWLLLTLALLSGMVAACVVAAVVLPGEWRAMLSALRKSR